jgi:hypothetical protein
MNEDFLQPAFIDPKFNTDSNFTPHYNQQMIDLQNELTKNEQETNRHSVPKETDQIKTADTKAPLESNNQNRNIRYFLIIFGLFLFLCFYALLWGKFLKLY